MFDNEKSWEASPVSPKSPGEAAYGVPVVNHTHTRDSDGSDPKDPNSVYPYDESKRVVPVSHEEFEHVAHEDRLRRSLTARQVQMIAIGRSTSLIM